MLAEDYIESKVRFPIGMQPKIDGVRSVYLNNKFTGRSLKGHNNLYVNKKFGHPIYTGLDGEMASLHECHPDLCRITTGDLNRIKGEPNITWHCFDYITDNTYHLKYLDRYKYLHERLNQIKKESPEHHSCLKLIPMIIANDLEELNKQDARFLELGYEGSILRDLDGLYKEGRSTVKEGGLLRIKRFIEEDARVIRIIEGNANENEAQTNPLGRTERSSSQDGMIPNGMIGSLECIDLKTGNLIIVSAGSMSHDLRKYYFENPHLILGQIIKYKHFPKGVLNKPRFPTFQCIRMKSDIV